MRHSNSNGSIVYLDYDWFFYDEEGLVDFDRQHLGYVTYLEDYINNHCMAMMIDMSGRECPWTTKDVLGYECNYDEDGE